MGEESYTRDRIGNILTNSSSEGTTTFTYDPLYRLTDAVYPGAGNTYNYTYDGVGNRLTQTVDTTTQFYIYNEGNRLLEIRDGSVTGPLENQFSYDDDGNMTERWDGLGTLLHSYSTDAKGRITQMITGGELFTYSYDPMDYRISKAGPGVAADYLLEGEHVEKVTGSHQPAQFFRGVVIDEIVNGYQYDPQGVWTNYTYAHDSLQSVVGLSGHEGATIQTTQYAPFGDEIGGAGASCSVLRYTGRERDTESGLYYYRARHYDPGLGRFLTEDTLGFSEGVNFYAYVNNNPINLRDPTGQSPLDALSKYLGLGSKLTRNQLDKIKGLSNIRDIHIERLKAYKKNPDAHDNKGHLQRAGDNLIRRQSIIDGRIKGLTHSINDYQNQINSLKSLDGQGFFDLFFSVGNRFLIVLGLILSVPGDTPVNPPSDFNNSNPEVPDTQPSFSFNIDPAFADVFNASAGGFVIYPNKPNTNMLQQVYKK